MSKTPVHEILNILGADTVQAKFGVSEFSIKHARSSGRFPASWYGEISKMCADNGIDCPMRAFNFKSPSSDTPLSGGS